VALYLWDSRRRDVQHATHFDVLVVYFRRRRCVCDFLKCVNASLRSTASPRVADSPLTTIVCNCVHPAAGRRHLAWGQARRNGGAKRHATAAKRRGVFCLCPDVHVGEYPTKNEVLGGCKTDNVGNGDLRPRGQRGALRESLAYILIPYQICQSSHMCASVTHGTKS